MKKNATNDTHNKDNQYNEDRKDNIPREYNHGNDNLITLKKPISLLVKYSQLCLLGLWLTVLAIGWFTVTCLGTHTNEWSIQCYKTNDLCQHFFSLKI
jgi:hypothetical protein